jgi:hypothetical protein
VSAAEAQALAYALEIGAAGLTEAHSWADDQIARVLIPCEELLELSTERSLANAVALLHILGREAPPQVVGKLVYRWLLKAISDGSLKHERAAAAVVRLARESTSPSTDAAAQSWHFDDAFYLARHEMYGTEAEVSRELENHLRQFEA